MMHVCLYSMCVCGRGKVCEHVCIWAGTCRGKNTHFCQRHCHAPSPWTHILPISLETLKLSGSITNRRRHAPVPWTHILPISLETLTNRRRHAPVPWTHILPISLETLTNRRRHAPVPWTH